MLVVRLTDLWKCSSHTSVTTDRTTWNIRVPSLLPLSHPQLLTHQTVATTLHRQLAPQNYCTFCNKTMDLLRNGFTTAVDYIERLLFYILRMSDFCYLHPSTAARQRMAIDFCSFAKDVWERPWNNRAEEERAESSGIEG